MRIGHKKYETVKILLETSHAVGSTLSFDRVVDLILTRSVAALDADHASLFLVDEASGRLMLIRAKGFSGDQLDNIRILGGWESVNNQLIKKKRPIIRNDVEEGLRIGAFLAVPLKKKTPPQVIGALIVSNEKRSGRRFFPKDKELLVALANYVSIGLLNAKLYESLKNLFLSTVQSLITAVDAKDRYTSGHSERVMKYSVAIGKALKIGSDALENLRLSSLLHDVGKIGINDAVLSKPFGLVPGERRLIMGHPLIGARIIEPIDTERRITRGIAEHHEWFNGNGYPNRLRGRAISLEGRVIAIADAFDALTTERPYRKPVTSKKAILEIKNGSGSQFDPRIVSAFAASFSMYPAIWQA